MPDQGRPEGNAGEAAYEDNLSLRLSSNSSARAVLFSLLILGVNIWARFLDAAHADTALLLRIATAPPLLMVPGLRSDDRRVGKERVRTGRSRGPPSDEKQR